MISIVPIPSQSFGSLPAGQSAGQAGQVGFEYDIFNSYRHNDNRSGWVTEFVNALHEELASIIKESLIIYFPARPAGGDKNPRDGLLETHNVDKSLEGKLKCLTCLPAGLHSHHLPKPNLICT